jgi:hypothetical protein
MIKPETHRVLRGRHPADREELPLLPEREPTTTEMG